jgi:hypothetical protein
MQNAVEYLVRVKPDGTIPRKVSEAVRDKLKGMVGREVVIVVGEWKPPRSNQQNRYYHGVEVKRIHRYFLHHGNDWTTSQVSEFLKEEVGGLIDVLYLPNGQKRRIPRSSTSLDTAEWEVFMEKCREWAARVLEMVIPLPNEVLEDDQWDDAHWEGTVNDEPRKRVGDGH